jgi:3-keto-L-gulonate-6-phosphate decarboxylase
MPIHPVRFQLSLDQSSLDDALELASVGVEAGVHVLEAGTILLLAEGARRVIPTLRSRFPDHPVVADMKCTDGVEFEFALAFDLGAEAATVMSSASDASIRAAVRAAEAHPGTRVMVDTMGCAGPWGRDIQGQVYAAARARDLGADVAVVHLGYDERLADRSMVEDDLLLKWAEAVAAAQLGIGIQVVGGLTMAQAAVLPKFGIREVVISMNLGAAHIENSRYDEITAFSLDLQRPDMRSRTVAQVQRFIASVE